MRLVVPSPRALSEMGRSCSDDLFFAPYPHHSLMPPSLRQRSTSSTSSVNGAGGEGMEDLASQVCCILVCMCMHADD